VHKIDALALLSTVVGVLSLATDATFSTELSTLFGAYAPKILALLSVLGLVCSQVLRVYGNPTTSETITKDKS
jgi:hypothetical protein